MCMQEMEARIRLISRIGDHGRVDTGPPIPSVRSQALPQGIQSLR